MNKGTKEVMQLIADYYTVNSLFENNGTKLYKIEDITVDMINEFKTKFIDNMSPEEFKEYFEIEDKYYYYTVSSAIDNLLVVNKTIKYKEVATISQNDINISIRKYRDTVYLILENSSVIFYHRKNKVLGNVSLTDNNKYWYSYLSSLTEEYLGLNGLRSREEMINKIEELIK